MTKDDEEKAKKEAEKHRLDKLALTIAWNRWILSGQFYDLQYVFFLLFGETKKT